MRPRLATASGLAAALLLAPTARAEPAPAPAAPPAAQVASASPGVSPASAEPEPRAVKPRRGHTRGDPLEGVNRALFSIHQTLDRILFRPVAIAYKTVVPRPLRAGIRHFFSNVGEPVVFLNDMLQLKPKRAIRTVARFAINSTLGLGGLIDVAREPNLDLPHHPNGFGDTLGRYGVGPGPYLFLPLVGPTDLRDFAGGQADGLVLPVAVGNPFDRIDYQIPHVVLTGLDLRAESDSDLKTLLEGAADPYATLRSVYLQSRAAEIGAIRHGAAAASPLDDPLADPLADPAGAPTAPAPPSATDMPADPPPPPAAP